MDNNPDLPDGWAMPDDLARKINEVVIKKPVAHEDDLQESRYGVDGQTYISSEHLRQNFG